MARRRRDDGFEYDSEDDMLDANTINTIEHLTRWKLEVKKNARGRTDVIIKRKDWVDEQCFQNLSAANARRFLEAMASAVDATEHRLRGAHELFGEEVHEREKEADRRYRENTPERRAAIIAAMKPGHTDFHTGRWVPAREDER